MLRSPQNAPEGRQPNGMDGMDIQRSAAPVSPFATSGGNDAAADGGNSTMGGSFLMASALPSGEVIQADSDGKYKVTAPEEIPKLADAIMEIINRLNQNQPVRAYSFNTIVHNRREADVRKIAEAFRAKYGQDLRTAVFNAINNKPHQHGDLLSFFSWLPADGPYGVSSEKEPGYDKLRWRDRSSGGLLPGSDPVVGTNYLFVDIPEKYAPVGSKIKIVHTDDRDLPPRQLPRLVKAAISSPTGKRYYPIPGNEGKSQSFEFVPVEEGSYHVMAHIVHPDGHVETLTRYIDAKNTTKINEEAFNASVGKTASPGFNTFRGGLELTEMEMERKNSAVLPEMVKYQKMVDEHVQDMDPRTIIPVGGAYTAKDNGASVRMNVFLGKGKPGKSPFIMADFTPGSGRKPYTGNSVDEVLSKFNADNTYPDGVVRLQNPKDIHGIKAFNRKFQTDGRSFLQGLSEGFGWASLGLTAAGLAALVIPGGQVAAPWLFLAAGAAGAGSGALSLADQFKDAEMNGTTVAIDVLGIVASLMSAGGAASALRVGSNAFRVGKLGSYLIVPGLAVDGASTVLISAQAYGQIAEIRRSNLPEGEKIARITRILATVSANAGLLALDAKSTLGKPRRIEGGPSGASPRVDEDNWMYRRGGIDEMIDAAKFYSRMEKLTDGSDVAAIVKNTGMPQRVVSRVRSHVFDEVHDISYMADNGEFRRETGGFSADINITPLWRGALEGNLDAAGLADFTDLLAHEYLESRLMQAGLPFRDPVSVKRGKVEPTDGLGAHNLSYNTSFSFQQRNGKPINAFNGWAEYGMEYKGPALARDLSNIDEVNEAILATVRQRPR